MRISDKQVLKRLATAFNVDKVRYNIVTDNFVYYKDDKKHHITMESLVHGLKHGTIKTEDKELENWLHKLHDSYFNRRLLSSIEDFYEVRSLPFPRNIFVKDGKIEFPIYNDIFKIDYSDNFNDFLYELDVKVQLNKPSYIKFGHSDYPEPSNETFIAKEAHRHQRKEKS